MASKVNLATSIFVLLFATTVLMPERSAAYLIDPVSIGAAVLDVAHSCLQRIVGWRGYDSVRTYFAETCDDGWIKPNMTGLHNDLTTKLHGQHLVHQSVMSKMRLHIRNENPGKPLALSFHGWTGSGKNFVSSIIVNNLFKAKGKSGFVHWFIGNVHFPHKTRIEQYKDDLINWISGNVSNGCDRSVFIFDEVDKMPIGLLDSVKPFLDNYEHINGVDFRRCIFIFLSNTGGSAITTWMLEHWESGKKREDVRMEDFHELIEQGAFNEMINERGGLYRSSMIDRHLIDYYIPFLPLEREHVKLCARDAFRRRGTNPSNEALDKVADMMPYYPDDRKLFSRVGCKRIENKVNEYMYSNDEL